MLSANKNIIFLEKHRFLLSRFLFSIYTFLFFSGFFFVDQSEKVAVFQLLVQSWFVKVIGPFTNGAKIFRKFESANSVPS